jgi:hypothetical protein
LKVRPAAGVGFVRSATVGDGSLRYGVLARFAYKGTTLKIGQRRIALLLGIHVETVNLALHELEDGEHISIRGRGRARRVYHLGSSVFGRKQRAGFEEVISSPSRTRRLASTRIA